MNREEKIQLYRGAIQTIGLIILIIGMVWMIKNFNERKIMGECVYVDENGNETHTGLYGNCSWYQDRINPKNEKILKNPPLQNDYKVKDGLLQGGLND